MKEEALKRHLGGKIAITSRVELENSHDLALAYTPGVAYPCLEIKDNIDNAYLYTSKGHMVLIATDGSAVLGLGNIGAAAAMPVMEGKALLLKKFSGLDCFPIVVNSNNVEKIIEVVKLVSLSCGGIILEDISSPRCVEIERRLQEELDIPVFHDDQHGTAIVVGAAMINASRFLKKSLESMRVVVSGVGAAGSAVIRILKGLGVGIINAYNKEGVICTKNYNAYDFVVKELIDEHLIDIPDESKTTLASLLVDADCFIGLSAPNIVTKEMVKTMHKDPIIFALANPTPEIMPNEAILGGAKIIGTGRSDFPNQINNVLAFPGIFKGALSVRAKKITEEMKLASAKAIASIISDEELNENYIIPSAFDMRVVDAVSEMVKSVVKKA